MRAGRNTDWRNDADYDYLDGLTPEETAFEFLRRNPDYRESFEAMSRAVAAGDAGEAERLAASWGLRCRSGPEFAGRSGADHLACRAQPAGDLPRPCAGRVRGGADITGTRLAIPAL